MKVITRDPFAGPHVGEVVYLRSMNMLLGEPGKELMVTWKCRKGYRYALVLLGVENLQQPIDPDKRLETLGWEKKKAKRARKTQGR